MLFAAEPKQLSSTRPLANTQAAIAPQVTGRTGGAARVYLTAGAVVALGAGVYGGMHYSLQLRRDSTVSIERPAEIDTRPNRRLPSIGYEGRTGEFGFSLQRKLPDGDAMPGF